MRRLLLFVLLASIKANATNYHFSNSGNDNNAGTISSPFATLEKLRSLTLVTGDSIGFDRGSIFYGYFKAVSGVTYYSYGTGNEPIISGFETLSGWTSLNNGIYQATCTNCKAAVKAVSVDGYTKGMGRWPNTGYRYIVVDSFHHFTDTTLHTDNSINWAGASVVSRKAYYITDVDSVISISGDTVRYQIADRDRVTSGYGYFFQNSMLALDTLHEWHYNRNTKVFSMYFGANNPNNYVVQVSTIDTLSSMANVHDVTFKGIAFQGSNKISTSLYGVHNILIDSCKYNFSGTDGIWGKTYPTDSSSYITITNNTFKNTNNNALNLEPTYHHYSILRNNFDSTSMIEGLGMNDNNAGQAIVTSGRNGLIKYNVIKHTGYNAIRWDGDSTKVLKNLIDSVCLKKDDGGGIYSFAGVYRSIPNQREVSNNIILNGLGAKEGTPQVFRTMWVTHQPAMGIYTDIATQNVLIKNNTLYNCDGAGISVLVNRDIRIIDNNLYNNTSHIMYNGTPGSDSLSNITSASNKIVALNHERVFHNVGIGIYGPTNRFDSNYVAIPYNHTDLYQGGDNLATFQANTGYDLHTKYTTKTSTDIFFDYNASETIKKVWLDGTWYDATGKAFSNTIFLDPYTSVVLMKINPQVKIRGSKLSITR